MAKLTWKSGLMKSLLVMVLMHEIVEDPSTAEHSILAKCQWLEEVWFSFIMAGLWGVFNSTFSEEKASGVCTC